MSAVRPAGTLCRLLTPQRIVIWDDPVSRQDVRRALVDTIVSTVPGLNADVVMQKLAEREQQGSTFLNEGIALPHARLDKLDSPQVALGLTRAGLLDVVTEQPISAVFLLLSPASGANVHLQVLAKAGRALQNRELRSRPLPRQHPRRSDGSHPGFRIRLQRASGGGEVTRRTGIRACAFRQCPRISAASAVSSSNTENFPVCASGSGASFSGIIGRYIGIVRVLCSRSTNSLMTSAAPSISAHQKIEPTAAAAARIMRSVAAKGAWINIQQTAAIPARIETIPRIR